MTKQINLKNKKLKAKSLICLPGHCLQTSLPPSVLEDLNDNTERYTKLVVQLVSKALSHKTTTIVLDQQPIDLAPGSIASWVHSWARHLNSLSLECIIYTTGKNTHSEYSHCQLCD